MEDSRRYTRLCCPLWTTVKHQEHPKGKPKSLAGEKLGSENNGAYNYSKFDPQRTKIHLN